MSANPYLDEIIVVTRGCCEFLFREKNHVRRNRIQKCPVVPVPLASGISDAQRAVYDKNLRYNYKRSLKFFRQVFLKPHDSGKVEVVCGFVKQQHIWTCVQGGC